MNMNSAIYLEEDLKMPDFAPIFLYYGVAGYPEKHF